MGHALDPHSLYERLWIINKIRASPSHTHSPPRQRIVSEVEQLQAGQARQPVWHRPRQAVALQVQGLEAASQRRRAPHRQGQRA